MVLSIFIQSKQDEIDFESSEGPKPEKVQQSSGAGLFSKKGKPKVFSWGDAALTANISSEKVSSKYYFYPYIEDTILGYKCAYIGSFKISIIMFALDL